MIYGLSKYPFWGYIIDIKYDVVFSPLNNNNRSILFKGAIQIAAKLMPLFFQKIKHAHWGGSLIPRHYVETIFLHLTMCPLVVPTSDQQDK